MLLSVSPIKVIKALLEVEEAVGNFIAGPEKTGLSGHAQAGYRKRCDQFANAAGWVSSIPLGPLGALNRICTPYWNEEGTSPPVSSPPFTGGQCGDPVRYAINFQYNSILTNGDTIEPPVVVVGNPSGPGFVGPIKGIEGRGAPDFQRIVLMYGNGQEINLRSGNCPQGCYRNIKLNSVVRVGGAPDDCGDPPSEITPGPNPPPNPGPTPGPEPTIDPSNPTGPPLLPIPDYEDPIGGPTAIVAPELEEPTLGPEDIPGSFDTQPGGAENVGDPIEVDPSSGSGGDGTDFGVPPAGRAWVGCLLRFTFPAGAGAIAGSGPTNPVSPRTFGNASLVYEGGLGTAHRVNSGNMSVIRDSGALKVTGVYVNVLPGFTYNIRPISVELCPTNSCGEA